jgi:peptidoglycan/LPS O-acetylase OafA/YrhL
MTTDKHPLAADAARLHALDTVRAVALLLGVVLHATMSWFPGPQVWLVKDGDGSVLASSAFFLIHMPRMLTFFLIAGLVARLSFDRLGAARFFRDRLMRIGLPLVLFWPILFVALMGAAGMLRMAWGTVTFATFPLMHLWFLYLLAIFYAALALLHPLLARLGAVARVLRHPGALVPLAAPLALCLYLHPYWVMWFGIPTPDRSLTPNLAATVGYGMAFLFGWLMQGRLDVLELWARRWPLYLALALACTAACLHQVGAAPLLMPAPQGSAKLLYAACYSLGSWSWALALIGLAQRCLNGHSPVRRYLADASYWIYLVHLPLVVYLQSLFARVAWPWALELALLLALAFALMLVTYALFVRRTFVGVLLNGRKKF